MLKAYYLFRSERGILFYFRQLDVFQNVDRMVSRTGTEEWVPLSQQVEKIRWAEELGYVQA